MNSKQQKIWDLIFSDPVSSKVQWKDVESLFIALGLEIKYGRGSRLRVAKDELWAHFHQPHPHKELVRKAVVHLRKFLKEVARNAQI